MILRYEWYYQPELVKRTWMSSRQIGYGYAGSWVNKKSFPREETQLELENVGSALRWLKPAHRAEIRTVKTVHRQTLCAQYGSGVGICLLTGTDWTRTAVGLL